MGRLVQNLDSPAHLDDSSSTAGTSIVMKAHHRSRSSSILRGTFDRSSSLRSSVDAESRHHRRLSSRRSNSTRISSLVWLRRSLPRDDFKRRYCLGAPVDKRVVFLLANLSVDGPHM